MNINSDTAGSSIVADSLSKKRLFVSDQVKSSCKKVRCDKNFSFLPETLVSSKPEFSSKDYYLDALKNLQKSGKIQVIYPKQSLGHLVSAPATATSTTADKNTLFSRFFLIILLKNFLMKIWKMSLICYNWLELQLF